MLISENHFNNPNLVRIQVKKINNIEAKTKLSKNAVSTALVTDKGRLKS